MDREIEDRGAQEEDIEGEEDIAEADEEKEEWELYDKIYDTFSDPYWTEGAEEESEEEGSEEEEVALTTVEDSGTGFGKKRKAAEAEKDTFTSIGQYNKDNEYNGDNDGEETDTYEDENADLDEAFKPSKIPGTSEFRVVLGVSTAQLNAAPAFDDLEGLRDAFFRACSADERLEVRLFLDAPVEPTSEEIAPRFAQFKKEEFDSSGQPQAYLVAPSGSLNARLGVKLNYPTFHTKRPMNGNAADDTNPCTSLLCQKGLQEAFWFERYFRRMDAPKVRSIWMDSIPKELEEIHRRFSLWCEESSRMKVLLLFGVEGQKDFLARHQDMTILRVPFLNAWTVTVGILRHEDAIRLIVVFLFHPEWLIRSPGITPAKHFDACINLAAALAKYPNVDPSCFKERAEKMYTGDLLKETGDFKTQMSRSRQYQIETGHKHKKAAAQKRRETSTNAYNRSIVTRAEQSVEVWCRSCKSEESKRLDRYPTFGTIHTIDGCYIARSSTDCPTSTCCLPTKSGMKSVTYFIPVDPKIKYLTGKNVADRWNRAAAATKAKWTAVMDERDKKGEQENLENKVGTGHEQDMERGNKRRKMA